MGHTYGENATFHVIYCDHQGCKEHVSVKAKNPSRARRVAEREHFFCRDGPLDLCSEHAQHRLEQTADTTLFDCPHCGKPIRATPE